MINIFKHRLTVLLLSFLSFYLFYTGLSLFYAAKGNAIERWSNNRGEAVDIISYQRVKSPTSKLFHAKIRIEPGEILVVPRISGNSIEIRIDGSRIAKIGSETGNIWHQFHWISIPEEFSGKEADLSLEINGLYDWGVWEYPYLVRENDFVLFRFLTSLVFNNIYWILTGVLLVLSVLLFYYSFIDSGLRQAYTYTIISLLFGALYLFDFIFRSGSGSVANYLLLRKFLLVSGYLAPWFLLAGVESYLRGKLQLARISAISLLLVPAILFLPSSLDSMKNFQAYAGIFAYVNLLIVLLVAWFYKRNFMIFSFGFFQATILSGLIYLFSFKSHIFVLQFGFILAIVSVAYSIVMEFGKLYDAYRRVQKKSMTDALTGAYNRYYLSEATVKKGDLVIVADMDRFKEINDAHGHETGDRVLVEWVNCVKTHIRETDDVIRTGGDEFVIILHNTHGNDDLMEKISNDFRTRMEGLKVSFSYGMETIDTSIEDAVKKADSGMYTYKRKTSKKKWYTDLF